MTPLTPNFSRRQVAIGEPPATNGSTTGGIVDARAYDDAPPFNQGEIAATDDEVDAHDTSEPEMTEDQVIAGMIAAAQDKSQLTERIRIVRNQPDGSKKTYFSFEIHGLDDPDNEAAYRGASEIVNGRGGTETIKRTHMAEMRSRIIYLATVGEKGAKIWDNRQVRRAVPGAMNAYELIDKMLLSAEKDEIIVRIERLSGSGASFVDPLHD